MTRHAPLRRVPPARAGRVSSPPSCGRPTAASSHGRGKERLDPTRPEGASTTRWPSAGRRSASTRPRARLRHAAPLARTCAVREGDAPQLRHDLGARGRQERQVRDRGNVADARPRETAARPAPAGRVPCLRRWSRLPLRPPEQPGLGAFRLAAERTSSASGTTPPGPRPTAVHDHTRKRVRRVTLSAIHRPRRSWACPFWSRRQGRLRRHHRVDLRRLGGDVPLGHGARRTPLRLDSLAAADDPPWPSREGPHPLPGAS